MGTGSAGCIDAKGNFDQFADRVGFVDASTIDRAGGGLHDISGTFLYATRAGFETSNNPDYYNQFILRSTLTITGDTGLLDGALTPLCVATTCTERNEIPPALVSEDVVVNADGTYEAVFSGTLPGGANPISGTPISLTTNVSGTIMSADFLCGEISGSAAGIDLTGSTFAAIRITDTTPANLPAPVAACPSSGGEDAGVDAPVPDATMPDAAVDAGVDADETDAA